MPFICVLWVKMRQGEEVEKKLTWSKSHFYVRNYARYVVSIFTKSPGQCIQITQAGKVIVIELK